MLFVNNDESKQQNYQFQKDYQIYFFYINEKMNFSFYFFPREFYKKSQSFFAIFNYIQSFMFWAD